MVVRSVSRVEVNDPTTWSCHSIALLRADTTRRSLAVESDMRVRRALVERRRHIGAVYRLK